MVSARQNFRDLADRWPNLAGVGCLDINLIYISHQSLLKVVRIGRRGINPIQRRLLLAWRGYAENLSLGSGEWNHDEIVLICSV